MNAIRTSAFMALIVSAATMTAAATAIAPAHADNGVGVFLKALSSRGLGDIDPARATAVGQAICPRLVEPGQAAADVVANVATVIGRPLGPATMFTGIAISVFCPGAVAALASGHSPIPLGLLGL